MYQENVEDVKLDIEDVSMPSGRHKLLKVNSCLTTVRRMNETGRCERDIVAFKKEREGYEVTMLSARLFALTLSALLLFHFVMQSLRF